MTRPKGSKNVKPRPDKGYPKLKLLSSSTYIDGLYLCNQPNCSFIGTRSADVAAHRQYWHSTSTSRQHTAKLRKQRHLIKQTQMSTQTEYPMPSQQPSPSQQQSQSEDPGDSEQPSQSEDQNQSQQPGDSKMLRESEDEKMGWEVEKKTEVRVKKLKDRVCLEVQSGKIVGELDEIGEEQEVQTYLVTKEARLWEMRQQQPVQRYEYDLKGVQSIQVKLDGRSIPRRADNLWILQFDSGHHDLHIDLQYIHRQHCANTDLYCRSTGLQSSYGRQHDLHCSQPAKTAAHLHNQCAMMVVHICQSCRSLKSHRICNKLTFCSLAFPCTCLGCCVDCCLGCCVDCCLGCCVGYSVDCCVG